MQENETTIGECSTDGSISLEASDTLKPEQQTVPKIESGRNMYESQSKLEGKHVGPEDNNVIYCNATVQRYCQKMCLRCGRGSLT